VVLSQLFVGVLDVNLASESNSEVDTDGRYIVSRIEYDLNRATIITIPNIRGSTDDRLAFEVVGVTHEYTLSGGVLYLDGVELNSYATGVTSFAVTRIGNGLGTKDMIKAVIGVNSKSVQSSGRIESRVFETVGGPR
jgi:hypothetical protein